MTARAMPAPRMPGFCSARRNVKAKQADAEAVSATACTPNHAPNPQTSLATDHAAGTSIRQGSGGEQATTTVRQGSGAEGLASTTECRRPSIAELKRQPTNLVRASNFPAPRDSGVECAEKSHDEPSGLWPQAMLTEREPSPEDTEYTEYHAAEHSRSATSEAGGISLDTRQVSRATPQASALSSRRAAPNDAAVDAAAVAAMTPRGARAALNRQNSDLYGWDADTAGTGTPDAAGEGSATRRGDKSGPGRMTFRRGVEEKTRSRRSRDESDGARCGSLSLSSGGQAPRPAFRV